LRIDLEDKFKICVFFNKKNISSRAQLTCKGSNFGEILSLPTHIHCCEIITTLFHEALVVLAHRLFSNVLRACSILIFPKAQLGGSSQFF